MTHELFLNSAKYEQYGYAMAMRAHYKTLVSQGKRPKGLDKTLVETATEKKVLSSDIRLYLEKLQCQQRLDEEDKTRKQTDGVVDDELRTLETELKLLAEKIGKKKEILGLQREFSNVSESRISSEYQTEDYDSSWRPTVDMEYSGYEESSGSYASKIKRKKQTESNDSEEEGSHLVGLRGRKSMRHAKFEEDVALIKNFIRTQSGGLKATSESPLAEYIENAKINRDLKVPPIKSLDESTDPADLIKISLMEEWTSLDIPKWLDVTYFPLVLKARHYTGLIIYNQGQSTRGRL